MKQKIIQGLELVRSLYKSIGSCSNHHTDDVIELLHIETAIDQAIIAASRQKKIVILRVIPGDGKLILFVKYLGFFRSTSVKLRVA